MVRFEENREAKRKGKRELTVVLLCSAATASAKAIKSRTNTMASKSVEAMSHNPTKPSHNSLSLKPGDTERKSHRVECLLGEDEKY